MNILYCDAGVNVPHETYSAKNAKRYGGGACFARYALTLLNNNKDTFHIIAPKDSFEDLDESENPHCCFGLDNNQLEYLRRGGDIRGVVQNIDFYDIVVHHHDCFFLHTFNCKPKLVHWSLMGENGAQHSTCPYTLLYRPGEKARFGESFPIVIGKYVPETFVQYKKENYIFQCSRHDVHMNSRAVAKFCLENNIKGIFAGPILDNYPLMDYVDNKTTFYLGLISENEKISHLKTATATTYLHTWNTAFNLSAVESLAYGTPIITSKRGCFNYLTLEGKNGFFWSPESNLLELYQKCQSLDQEKVWKSAQRFSHTAMVNSFYKAFQEILKD